MDEGTLEIKAATAKEILDLCQEGQEEIRAVHRKSDEVFQHVDRAMAELRTAKFRQIGAMEPEIAASCTFSTIGYLMGERLTPPVKRAPKLPPAVLLLGAALVASVLAATVPTQATPSPRLQPTEVPVTDKGRGLITFADAAATDGNQRGAIAYYERVVADHGESAEVLVKMAGCYLHTGEREKAVACCDQAVAIDGKCAAAYHVRGNARFGLGDKAGAVKDWELAAKKGDKTVKPLIANAKGKGAP